MKHLWEVMMMGNKCFPLLALALLLSGCARRPGNSPTLDMSPSVRRTHPEAAEGRIILALVDATGSFGSLRESLRRLARFAGEELKMGDTFGISFIKNQLKDSDSHLVPFITLPKPTRRLGDPAEAEALRLQKQIQTTLLTYAGALSFKKVERTDLFQAIAYGARQLRLASQRERWLLLFTDLEDTVGRRDVPLDLEGIHVRVFFVPTRGNLKGLDKKVAEWTQRFQKAKAASVVIYDVGQSRILPRLLTQPSTPSSP